MSFGVFLVLLLVLLLYMVVRAVRAGHGKVILWFALFFIGLAVILSGRIDLAPAPRLLVNLWVLSVVVLPVWWCLRWISKAPRRLK